MTHQKDFYWSKVDYTLNLHCFCKFKIIVQIVQLRTEALRFSGMHIFDPFSTLLSLCLLDKYAFIRDCLTKFFHTLTLIIHFYIFFVNFDRFI